MFTHSSPSPPTLATTTSPAAPTSPTPRTGRLRGLSYLRNYTHNHIHNHSVPSSSNTQSAHLSRSTSHPAQASTDDEPRRLQRSTTDQTRAEENITSGPTGGWLPTVGGLGGSSRIANRVQAAAGGEHSTSEARNNAPTADKDTSTETVMGRNRAGSASQGSRRTTPLPNTFLSSRALEFARLDGPTTTTTTPDVAAPSTIPAEQSTMSGSPIPNGVPSSSAQLPSIRFIPYQDPRSPRPPLAFAPVSRTLPDDKSVLKVGRYSERDSNPNPAPNVPSAAPIGFKSKVVSRRHCEFWCSNGRWYIKDAKSSSGTFLNHIRLSQPGMESRPFPVNDGDVVQLGIDFRGGEEMIFRCVKIRVELNRGWQKELNSFNMSTHKRLRNLTKSTTPKKDGDNASMHTSECSICLMSIAPCQSLFVAPCSHVWHYKCIRPILSAPTWPQFLCPNCRAVTDLEADVDDPSAYEDWEEEVDEGDEGKEEAEKVSEPPDIVTEARSNSGSIHRPMGLSDHEDEGEEEEATNHEALSTMMGSLAIAGEGQTSNQTIRSTQGEIVESPTLPDWHGSDGLLSRRIGNSTTPLNIDPPGPSSQKTENRPAGPGDSGRATPNDTGPAIENAVAEGPMTPRNNAGPFVFDGSAGRAAGRRIADNLSQDSIDGNNEGKASVQKRAYDSNQDFIDGNGEGRASVRRIADDHSQHSID
ncbi:MAG: hypothetical protein M1812_004298 [Candelaria pacifica]|nr:MAG: hypothetical protein M1812_004298 [Candelaria pacifica]